MAEKEHKKSKKSKKEKKRSILSTETLIEDNVQQLQNLSTETHLHGKKKKRKDIEGETENDSLALSEDATPADHAESLKVEKSGEKKKKKKHKKEKVVEDEQDFKDSPKPALDETSASFKKEKKCDEKKIPLETDFTADKVTKKTKKHKSKQNFESYGDSDVKNTSETKVKSLADTNSEAENPKKKKKEKLVREHDELSCVDNESINTKSKKKKRKRVHDNEDNVNEDCCEENGISVDEIKSKKKRKNNFNRSEPGGETFNEEKNKQSRESESAQKELNSNTVDKKKKKKRGKSKDVDSEEVNVEENEKHATLKKTSDSHVNTKSVTSQPQSPATTETQSPQVVGQWQGDMFGSTERQNKFLRLLGGMKKTDDKDAKDTKLFGPKAGAPKKGLFGSLVSRVGGGNALSASDAANLNQKLEEDYNRALDFKLNKKRGTGFGFVADPAEGKKFHIDVNKTNSVKFDD